MAARWWRPIWPVLQLQNFTIEAWIERGSATQASLSTNGGTIFGYGTGGYALGMTDGGNLFLAQTGVSGTNSQFQVTDTGLHHVAVTKNGSTVMFYIRWRAESGNHVQSGFSIHEFASHRGYRQQQQWKFSGLAGRGVGLQPGALGYGNPLYLQRRGCGQVQRFTAGDHRCNRQPRRCHRDSLSSSARWWRACRPLVTNGSLTATMCRGRPMRR